MDSNTETATKITKVSFVQHVFNFDEDTKNSILNIVQYIILAIIPITLLNSGINAIIPEFDGSKGNLELLAEIIGQTLMVFLGIFFIHRLITFVPSYSGRAYGSMNLFNVVLIFFVMSYDLNGSLGQKAKTLMKRVEELWGGKAEDEPKKDGKKQNVVTSSQPISGQMPPVAQPTHQASRADYVMQQQQMEAPQTAVQNSITGDSVYSGSHISKQGTNDVSGGMQEPMAANGALGGGFGSAW